MMIKPAHYTKEELRAMLPKIGDRLELPMMRNGILTIDCLTPEPCVVVMVNTEHYWYKVRFEKSGIGQCFKLP